MRSVLIVGGTGPTGYALTRRLQAAGDRVTIVHTGRHELDLGACEHIHCDPRSADELAVTLGSRRFDAAVSTSGRLREVLRVLEGRVGSLAAVTGLPAYVGWLAPVGQSGRPMPLREGDPAPRELGQQSWDKLSAAVIENEQAVLAVAARGVTRATVLRYTMVYGPYSYIPFEWYFVRRVLDGRRRIVLEADGLMLPQRGPAENLATAVLLAMDSPVSSGSVYNVGDEKVLSVRAIAETIAAALEHDVEFVAVPLAASPCRNPFALRQNALFDLGAIRSLGYRDTVGVVPATRSVARWLAEHPVARGSPEEASLGGAAFDYEAEDRVMAIYDHAFREVGR